jgi:hypothetical protein
LHRQVLDNALLHFLQAVVIGVEAFLRRGDVLGDLAALFPRQSHQDVDIVAHHRGFRRHRRHQAQLFQLGLGLDARVFGHARRLDFLLDFVQVRAVFALAQFLLDRLDLFVQVILSLALFHLPLDSAADALFTCGISISVSSCPSRCSGAP